MNRLKSSRREIVEAYAGADRLANLDAACTVLRIPDAERRLLTTATTDSWLDWGFDASMVPSPDGGGNRQWFTMLRVAAEFRHRARPSHRQLLDLLDTQFVQSAPGLAAAVVIAGDECDSSQMTVGDGAPGGRLTDSVLRRCWLFVRLAQRLGWSFPELDAAIRAYGRATDPATVATPAASSTEERFTEPFLIHLGNLIRLGERTGLALEAVINLFRAKLDTRRGWDHSGALPRRVPSYYERLLDDAAVARPRAPGLELNTAGDELRDGRSVRRHAPPASL